jgi:hypothetical protein
MPKFYESAPLVESSQPWKDAPLVEDEEGFEAPITPEEEAKLQVPLAHNPATLISRQQQLGSSLKRDITDPLGIPGRLVAAALGDPEPESPGQIIGKPLAAAGEALAGATSRLMRGEPAEAISKFGLGPEPLSFGQKESLLNVIPTEMARLAPTIAGSVALTAAGVPPSVATAAPFYAQTFAETGDPVAAAKAGAIGAVIPGVGSAGRAGGELMAQRVAGRMGAGEVATRALEATGRLVGSQSLVGGLLTASAAPELVELLKNDPEEYKRELLKIVGMNLAFEVPHLAANVRQVMAKDRVDAYFGSPEYKRGIDNLLVAQQAQSRMQGTTPIPPAELARLRGYEAQRAQRMGVALVPPEPTVEQQTIGVAVDAARSGLPMSARELVGEVIKPPKPTVPETPAEPRTVVTEEIRAARADTIKKIQDLFPDAKLTREQARVFRDVAFPKTEPSAVPTAEAPTIKTEPIDSGLIVPPAEPSKVTAPAQPKPSTASELDALQTIRDSGFELTPEQTTRLTELEAKGGPSAQQIESPTPPDVSVRQPEVAQEGQGQVSAPESGEGVLPRGSVIPEAAKGELHVTPPFSPEALQSERGSTMGITPSAPSIPTGAVGKFMKKTRQAFTVSGKLPREVHELQTVMEGQRRAAEFDIRMTQRDFLNTLGDVYGLSRAQRAGGGTRRIPPEDVQLMDEYLHGRTTPEQTAKIPPVIRGQLDTMRSQIEGWSQKTIDTLTEQLNRLEPDSAKAKSLGDLIETIQKNMDVYVHRSYRFFDEKTPAPDFYEKVPIGDRIRAEQYLSTARGITPEQAQRELLNWLSDLRDESSFGTGGKLGSKDLTMFLRRKDIPQELRAVLGEYRNPLINYAKSVGKMAQFVAKQKFLEEVKAKGMGNYLFEEGSNPPGFNARIAAEGSESMSPLSGLRTSQDIADAFKSMDTPVVRKGMIGGLVRGYLMLNAWTKFANTAQSLMTHSRNLLSRVPMAIHAGHVDPRYASQALKLVWSDFASSNKTWRPFLNRLYKLGVIGDTARASELREIFKDANLQDVAPAELTSWSLMRALKTSLVKVPGEIYRLTDEFGNIFGFLNERATQKRIHPDWTDAQLDTEAASIVRDIYPTYSEAPVIVKEFRKNIVVGPFVNFPYQVWRNVVNGIARSVHEIRSTNPVERETGWKRLGLQVAAASAPLALQEVSKLMLGITAQEEDDLRRFLAPYDKNSRLIFTGKDPKTGEITYINASRLDPYAGVTDLATPVISGIRQGKDVVDIVTEIGKETFRPWYSEQMLIKATAEARNGKTDTGRDLFNPTDSDWVKTRKRLAHVVTSLEPGTLQRAQKRIIPALKDEQPRFGRKLEPAQEIAREVTGIAVEKFNFKTALGFKVRSYMENSNAAEDVFRQVATRTQTTTPEQIVEAYRESEIRRRAYWEEMRADYLAALRRGVKPSEAAGILMARGLPKGEAKSIYEGRYIPQKVTEHVYKRAQEIGRTLPLKELFQEAQKGFPKKN